jgi:hypothetical protein
VGISRNYPLQIQTSKQHIENFPRYEIIPSHRLKSTRSKQGLKLGHHGVLIGRLLHALVNSIRFMGTFPFFSYMLLVLYPILHFDTSTLLKCLFGPKFNIFTLELLNLGPLVAAFANMDLRMV